MAKRTPTPPPAPEPDAVNEALLQYAEMLLGEFFFDPESEEIYQRTLSKNRPAGTEGVLLDEDKVELPDADCTVRIEALRALMHFRVSIAHPAFSATVEGIWS